MVKCDQCGTENEENATQCQSCGKKIPGDEISDETSNDKISIEKISDEKTSDEKTSDEKTSDEKTSDEKTSDEKTSDEKISDEKTQNFINKKFFLAAAIPVLLVLAGVVLIINGNPSISGLSDFDKSLINSVNNGESGDSLVLKIKDYAQINRQHSKTGYESLASGNMSNNDPTFLSEVKANYDKELAYIQKIEDVQIKFVNREIDAETFKKEIMKVYEQKPDMDF